MACITVKENIGEASGPRLGKYDWKEDCKDFIYLAKDQGRELLNAFKDKKP